MKIISASKNTPLTWRRIQAASACCPGRGTPTSGLTDSPPDRRLPGPRNHHRPTMIAPACGPSSWMRISATAGSSTRTSKAARWQGSVSYGFARPGSPSVGQAVAVHGGHAGTGPHNLPARTRAGRSCHDQTLEGRAPIHTGPEMNPAWRRRLTLVAMCIAQGMILLGRHHRERRVAVKFRRGCCTSRSGEARNGSSARTPLSLGRP